MSSNSLDPGELKLVGHRLSALCSAFHFDEDSKSCQLGSKVSLSEATTNPGNGSVTSVHINTEDVWHMVIGGWDGSGNVASVELFNWQTGVGCNTGKNVHL